MRLKHYVPLLRSLFITAMIFSVHCINEENESRTKFRDLKNKTSSFIYNVVPNNGNAKISVEYSKAINTFAVKTLSRVYHQQCKASGKNLVVSPLSISRNCAVLTEGTTGESKQELLNALGGHAALDGAKDALSQLLYADNSIILQCADAIFMNADQNQLKASFKAKVNYNYGVEILQTDFNDPEKSATFINSWVHTNTNTYIKQIISKEDLPKGTVMVLTNALYFEADWKSPFDITKTVKQNFTTTQGIVSVDMMNSSGSHEVRITNEYENAKLYYGTNQKDFFYMDVYKPTGISMDTFIDSVSLNALSNQDKNSYKRICMPKFFFTSEIDLIPVLKELGIKGIFNANQNEITEILEKSGEGLYVSLLKHKAGIKTDEEGTKAFAVTATALSKNSSPSTVVFDKPFVYYIRAGVNGLVLFAGVVQNPVIQSE